MNRNSRISSANLQLVEYYTKADKNLQCTMSIILLLTVGGTPFVAMHRYAPICSRFTLVMLNTGPSTLGTEKYTFQKFSFKEHGINDVA
jgi:hypothetical protein